MKRKQQQSSLLIDKKMFEMPIKQLEKSQFSPNLQHIQQQINNLDYESFEISSFVQSKNEIHKYFKDGFPRVNAPTLQLKEQQNQNSLSMYEQEEVDPLIQHLTGLSKKNTYMNNLKTQKQEITSRNDSIAIFKLQQRIIQLEKLSLNRENAFNKISKTNQTYIKKMSLLEQKVQTQSKIIEEKQRQLEKYRLKQSRSNMRNQQQKFCAQLLSPQQTMNVLTQLLKKVSKSALMSKQISKNHTLVDLLVKLHKIN